MIAQFLQEIPGAVWGVIGTAIGVIGTLSATYLSNSSNDDRFDRQLTHDAQEKAKDRAAELRRSVYLDAADQLIAVNAFLGGLASVDPTDKRALTDGLLGFMTATSRVQLVATEETRRRVAELSDIYGVMFFELMADASNAHLLQCDIKINRDSYDNLHLERLRLIAAMRDFNENIESKYIFDALSKSLDRTTPQIEKIMAEYVALTAKQNLALTSYGASLGEKMRGLAEILTEVTALLRKELDNEVDLEQMRIDSKLRLEKVKRAAGSLMVRFKEIQESGGEVK